MDPLVAHQRAQDAISEVLGNVKPHQLDAPTPCQEWTVRDLIEHVIGGNERVAIRAGLRSEPRARPGDLSEAHRATAADAQAVFAAPEGMTTMFELAIGRVPGSAFIRMRTNDALVHAWDLAKATGQPTDLDPELATRILASSRQHMTDSLRGPGNFYGEPQPCDQGRPAADQLAAFLGRAVD
jgi:uncharacterized protein (TIGR03086 family)